MKKIAPAILFACMAIGLYACRDKDKNPAVDLPQPVVDSPNFTWVGNAYVHVPVRFSSRFKTEQDLVWYFNEVEKDTTGQTVTYTFSQPGNYNVTMASSIGAFTAVTKNITVTNGLDRVDGDQKWKFFITREKGGVPPSAFPVITFEKTLAFTIIDDSTISIPDIPQLRIRGPYIVKKQEVSPKRMLFKSDDNLNEFSYTFDNFTGGIKITQVHKDTAWHLNGVANIIN